jgi:glycosyl transferase family 87
VSRLAALAGVATAAWSFLAVPACAQTAASSPRSDPNAPRAVKRLDVRPPGHRLTGAQARAIADRVPKIVAERRKHRGSYSGVFLKGATSWQVSYYARSKPLKEIGQVIVDDASGGVVEAWVGYQVPWTMARGYPGAFGRKVNAPWVWIPLSVLFVAPFVAPRRPLRMLHLDLLVLVGFGASLAFFNAARISLSTPLVYPLLVYLLARMLWVGLRRRPVPDQPLPLLVPVSWLALGIVFLLGFRIGLNLTNSNVIDVGYSGVIGADHLADGERIYGGFPPDNQHGDTYGPAAYAAYLPFEQLWPWHGRWDSLPAAHAAAIVFDLLCVGLLFLLGRRLRGPSLGVVLAYAWLAYPFTTFVSNTNSNDALVAAVLVGVLLVASSPPARGALAALAGLIKIAPLALAPVLATHWWGSRTRGRVRSAVLFAAGFAAMAAIAIVPYLLAGEDAGSMFDRTVAYQADRDTPFSIWRLYGWEDAQHAWQALAVVLAVGLAFVPRARDLAGLAALCAAVLIALQLGASYWFYLYIVWFFPLVLVALLGRHPAPAASP